MSRWKNKEKEREYQKQYQKEWRKRNKEKTARYKKICDVKDRYGITLEEYESRMDGVVACQCCGATDVRMNYDHDHDTMEFRGVLCDKCNTGIGLLGDDINGLLNAVEYMRRHYK